VKESGLEPRTLTSALENEHREIDRAVDEYLTTPDEGRERTECLTQAMTALRRHIFLEEE
jgi:regulator of cell morphogenesis and NO signaling